MPAEVACTRGSLCCRGLHCRHRKTLKMTTLLDLPADLLLTAIIMRGTFYGLPTWGGFASDSQVFEELHRLVLFGACSRGWRALIRGSNAYAAFVLAVADLEGVTNRAWIHDDPKAYIGRCFRQNLELLRTSRPLLTRISPRILRAALADLTKEDLVILRDALSDSCCRMPTAVLLGPVSSLQMWVTPEART